MTASLGRGFQVVKLNDELTPQSTWDECKICIRSVRFSIPRVVISAPGLSARGVRLCLLGVWACQSCMIRLGQFFKVGRFGYEHLAARGQDVHSIFCAVAWPVRAIAQRPRSPTQPGPPWDHIARK